MRAKLVYENIGNILKPKSEEDIIKDLSNLSQEEKDKKLIRASKYTQLEIIKMLIEAGADVNVKDINGYTALIYASGNGHKDIVKLLIENGADVNIKNEYGNTALIFASRYNDKDIIKLLIKAGAKE